MVREPPKSSCKMEMELDRISDLPDNIIEQILSNLSILDAARTCILSSKWRYRWNMLPILDFTQLSYQLMVEGRMVPNKLVSNKLVSNKLVSIIDQVLLLHVGPLHKFRLQEPLLLNDSAIDRWIRHLSRSPIKDITFGNCREPEQYYRVPSSLFACQSLINLELINCYLKPPSSFKGFINLKSLDFRHVNLAQDAFENMVSSCPMLETLKLSNVMGSRLDGFFHLNINVPSLRFFSFEGVVANISFENTLFLAEVTIRRDRWGTYDPNRASSHSSNLLRFLVHLPRIQRLELDHHIWKYLAAGVELGVLLKVKPCIHLTYLEIEINLNNWEESLTALCLLSSAPSLQELIIDVHHSSQEETITGKETNFGEDEWQNRLMFTKLQLARVIGVSTTKSEMDFIKFLLSNSPLLERMVVMPASDDVELELFKKVLALNRASSQAQIICLDHQWLAHLSFMLRSFFAKYQRDVISLPE